MTSEQRKHPRYDVRVAAEVAVQGEVLPAETRNLSEGGVGLAMSKGAPVGSAIDVTLLLTQDGIEDPHAGEFVTRAQVAWCRGNGPFDVGVQFGSIGPGQQKILERFLSALKNVDKRSR